ncbi:hypothetical protein H9L19_03880 [Weissella diestrammenae]|uniref:Uncharacterized protein n=2 Tax=Weissella diestrammenae TaxID=1162633 RepID=A0A7G9T7K5_9LACO|nr:hypothetical protein [Weissella diestrammenae]QNN76080.1 hypothetical protein H9L19_03880 [Weissella diestrammenae]
MSDLNRIPESMTEVMDQVDQMTRAGFPVKVDDVVKEALKNGFQSLLDERMDGHYYSVHWDSAFEALDVFGSGEELVGQAKPAPDQDSWITQFKTNADVVWFNLDRAAGKLIGR